MYYITFYSRLGDRITVRKSTKPRLLYHSKANLNRLNFYNLPPLTNEELKYSKFRIPKASGGFREINAPTEALKKRQRELVDHLQQTCSVLESPWAYAYIKNKSILDAVTMHQYNGSKWFLKIDIKDFFPSCTSTLVENSLKGLFPICAWSTEEQEELMSLLKQHCFLEDSLPQGAVTSPYLSNLIMVQYDYKIHEMLVKAEENGLLKQKYIYTRYADDIIISAKQPFNWKLIQDLIQSIFDPYFKLKKEKTRYGSINGRNWNLGLMLNKDNKITVGYKKKEQWKRTMMDIIVRHNNNEPISTYEKQHLTGLLSYYKMIEPGYFNYLNQHYKQKYNADFEQIITNYM